MVSITTLISRAHDLADKGSNPDRLNFNIETTQDYLNIELDLETTISDFVPF